MSNHCENRGEPTARESIAEPEVEKRWLPRCGKPPTSHPETGVVQRSTVGKTLLNTNTIADNER
jgi:hypothetical protein